MTALDWGIAAFTFVVALWGFRQGLIVGALGLGGLVAGAVLGSRLAPVVLDQGSNSPYAPMAALIGAIMVGSVTLAIAVSIGQRVRASAIAGPGWQIVDGIGGALLVAAVALGVVWVLGAVAIYTPGADSLRKSAQKSLLLGGINEVMPPSGPLIQALHRIAPTPQVATSPGDIATPAAVNVDQAAIRKAGSSVVRVVGTACGLGVMGSGWVVAPNTVVTNAHVVAGQTDTRVETPDGQIVDAVPIAYKPRNDIAVLAADIDPEPLAMLKNTEPGAAAAVIGYPGDGPLTLSPARAGTIGKVFGQDAYGSGPVTRLMLTLRGRVSHGNSGGPLVDSAGRVLGTVFAATTEGPPGGLAVPNRVVRRVVRGASGEVDTGPCAR
ncbi:MAG: MarP family serine protease [Solirubrobacterales bacterium]|nr:MarP family serine protease [Solirubrobacterales bacterium]